jgi:hypothetical protein
MKPETRNKFTEVLHEALDDFQRGLLEFMGDTEGASDIEVNDLIVELLPGVVTEWVKMTAAANEETKYEAAYAALSEIDDTTPEVSTHEEFAAILHNEGVGDFVVTEEEAHGLVDRYMSERYPRKYSMNFIVHGKGLIVDTVYNDRAPRTLPRRMAARWISLISHASILVGERVHLRFANRQYEVWYNKLNNQILVEEIVRGQKYRYERFGTAIPELTNFLEQLIEFHTHPTAEAAERKINPRYS